MLQLVKQAHVLLGLKDGKDPKVITLGDAQEVTDRCSAICAKGSSSYDAVVHYGNGKQVKATKVSQIAKKEKKSDA